MESGRRNFLTFASFLPAALSGAYPTESHAQPTEPLDTATLNFWTSRVRRPTDDLKAGISRRGSVEEPAFVYFDSKSREFSVATDLKDDDLAADGNANVRVRVERFRPSAAHRQDFEGDKTGTLRLDIGQMTPLPGLAEALAWSVIAAFVPQASGKLPSLDRMEFDPGKSWNNPQSIPLPDGAGFWAWNFFVKKPDSAWTKLINVFKHSSKDVFPLLGLPAVTLTALKAIDKILGYIQTSESSIWLLQSANKPMYATMKGKRQSGSDAVRLKSGTYLIMPQDQLAAFGREMSRLEIQAGGYVVPKGTDPFQRIAAAEKAIPEVTYFAVNVNCEVKKAEGC